MSTERKVAVITGASPGIGVGLVRGLFARGYRLIARGPVITSEVVMFALFAPLTRWLSRVSSACSPRPATSCRPRLEELEGRVVPAAYFSDQSGFASNIITSAQVVNVYIGAGWSTDPALRQMRQYVDACVADLVTSDFMTQMAEYTYNFGFGIHTPIGKGRFAGSVAMNATASRPVTDADIQSYLTNQLNNGSIPYPANSNDYVYMLYLAPGIQSQTCINGNAAAYHDHFDLPTGQYDHGLPLVVPVAYAVMPSPVNAVVGSDDWKHQITIYSSHELAEAVTDPNNTTLPPAPPYQVYYGYVDAAQHVEIADVAQGVIGQYHGYWIQGIWSNRAYAATGDGRILPPGAMLIGRTGRPDGVVNPNPRYTAFEQDDDLLAPFRPVPASAEGAYVTTQDTALDVQNLFAGATNPLGNPLSLVLETAPAHGRVVFATDGNGRFMYQPDPGYVGSDEFTYRLTDGNIPSTPVKASLRIFPATPPADLTELNSADWVGWAQGAGAVATLRDDMTRKVAGEASLAFHTNGAFDTSVRYVLPPAWNLSSFDHLHVAFYAENPNAYGFQNGSPWVRLIDAAGNYFEYQYYQGGQPTDILDAAIGSWQSQDIPLNASGTVTDGWRRTAFGAPDMSRITALEIHADTWGYNGFSLWIDDLGFRYVPNQQYVDAAYVDLFGRHAELTELQTWGNALSQSTLSRQQVASALTHSAEYYSTRIISAYQTYLGRTPTPSETQAWVRAMQGGLIDEQLQAGFIGSAEYYSRSGGTDRLWVTSMYNNLLRRTPSSSEVDGWVRALAAGLTRAHVAYAFATSNEREGIVVQDDYVRYLGRNPSQAEVAGWVNAFENGYRNEDLVAGFIASDEYFRKHTQT